ncbi:sensor histidine kinase [Planomonospora corallina]|uniref:Sensor histidine kinase n=1 Tax=Planomonospora corallina TaxID=1806052 RepID=A0ABV8I9I6_9ACTN
MRGGQSLAQALEERLSDWSARTGIAVEVWALPARDASHLVVRAVLDTLAEALSNVERHSRAKLVSVAVTLGGGGLRMTVSDHGIGFDGAPAGRGVAAMRAHLAEIGGALTVKGVPGSGTTVTAIVPRGRV